MQQHPRSKTSHRAVYISPQMSDKTEIAAKAPAKGTWKSKTTRGAAGANKNTYRRCVGCARHTKTRACECCRGQTCCMCSRTVMSRNGCDYPVCEPCYLIISAMAVSYL
eukprot:306235-Amphidinium_carterae.1